MVKLTADLIAESSQHVNPCRERELDLRGYKFNQIENLGATLDQFDSMMMNDNDVKKIENFPYLPRLKALYLANNRIRKIHAESPSNIPNLKELNLANNEINDFADIQPIAGFKKLEYLTLIGSPVAAQKNYRLYVIHNVPQLRVFDYMKNTFTPGEELERNIKSRKGTGMPEEEKKRIKEAILAAKSLEEVEILQQQLQMGHIPGDKPKKVTKDPNAPEVDSDEEKMEE